MFFSTQPPSIPYFLIPIPHYSLISELIPAPSFPQILTLCLALGHLFPPLTAITILIFLLLNSSTTIPAYPPLILFSFHKYTYTNFVTRDLLFLHFVLNFFFKDKTLNWNWLRVSNSIIFLSLFLFNRSLKTIDFFNLWRFDLAEFDTISLQKYKNWKIIVKGE